MDTSPLVMSEIDAGAEFLERLNCLRPVLAACWLRESDDSLLYLWVALDGVNAENTKAGYEAVLHATRDMKTFVMDPFRVKVIAPDHPVARAVRELYRQYPGRVPPQPRGKSFAGMPVEELYIYPAQSR